MQDVRTSPGAPYLFDRMRRYRNHRPWKVVVRLALYQLRCAAPPRISLSSGSPSTRAKLRTVVNEMFGTPNGLIDQCLVEWESFSHSFVYEGVALPCAKYVLFDPRRPNEGSLSNLATYLSSESFPLTGRFSSASFSDRFWSWRRRRAEARGGFETFGIDLDSESGWEADLNTDDEPEGMAGILAWMRGRAIGRMARKMLATEWAHPIVPEALQHFVFALRQMRRWPVIRIVLLLRAGRGSVCGHDIAMHRALHFLRDNQCLQQVLFQFL